MEEERNKKDMRRIKAENKMADVTLTLSRITLNVSE